MLKMRRDLFQILYDRQMLRAYSLALAAADTRAGFAKFAR